MISVGIITAPRPRPTLSASLFSLHDAGCQSLVRVFAEPGSEPTPAMMNVRLVQNEERKGNFRNWVSALHVLLATQKDHYILICEDDITWSTNGFLRLEREVVNTNWNGVGMMSLYTPDRMAKMIGPRPPHGWHKVWIGFKMWGAQALLLPRRQAEMLLECEYFKSKINDPSIDKNIDGHISESLHRRGFAILYRIPCLVDHRMGDRNSSIYGDQDRPLLRTSHFRANA